MQEDWKEASVSFLCGCPGGSKAFLSMFRAKRSEISDTVTPFSVFSLVFCGRRDDFSWVTVLFCFLLFSAEPMAYGGSRAKSWIGAIAAGLHHSHSNVGSEPCLWLTPQFTATTDLTHWARPGIKPASLRILVRFVTPKPQQELQFLMFDSQKPSSLILLLHLWIRKPRCSLLGTGRQFRLQKPSP